MQREKVGGTTIVTINVLPCGEIDHPMWKLDTKKYLPAFNTGKSSEGTLDISLPVELFRVDFRALEYWPVSYSPT